MSISSTIPVHAWGHVLHVIRDVMNVAASPICRSFRTRFSSGNVVELNLSLITNSRMMSLERHITSSSY
jgi:hypothetical protein